MLTTPLDWPDDSSVYWWMKAQTGKRTVITVLGSLTGDGNEYFQPFEDRNCFHRGICRDWKAQFLPGETPPAFPAT